MPVPDITSEQLLQLREQFTGKISQIPPLFSNIRVDGKRAHTLARTGQSAELPPRDVEVFELEVITRSAGFLIVRCTVSAGTYVRSLARDIAAALGTCGHLTRLRRTAIGNFRLPNEAPAFADSPGIVMQQLTDDEALDFLPKFELTAEEARRFCKGQRIRVATVPQGIYRLHESGRFIGLGHIEAGVARVEKIYPN